MTAELTDVVPHFNTIERVLYDRLADQPHVKIETLFGAAFGLPTKGNTNRHMQQRLGYYFRVMNLKMLAAGWRIEPGEPRQTYALRRFDPKILAKTVAETGS